jgi:Leucine-rich repeat (LRR) protein
MLYFLLLLLCLLCQRIPSLLQHVGGAYDFPASELDALHALYSSTHGGAWGWRTNTTKFGIPWNFSQSNPNPCVEHWQGIECNSDCLNAPPCHIISLSLRSYNLTGTLPNNLGNLMSLKTLNFMANQLHGALPTSLQQLTNLTTLSVYHNSFKETFPTFITHMQSLQLLHLGNNFFYGPIPNNISHLTQLRDLDLRNNQFTGTLPSSIGNLTFLTSLQICNNHLVGTLPPSIAHASFLTNLVLCKNNFTGSFPESWLQLTQMKQLMLTENKLTGTLPITLGNAMPLLENIYLYSNAFRGQIPCSLGHASSLQSFELHDNRFSGTICPSWSALHNINTFILKNNILSGTIPDTFFTNFTKATEISLSLNAFNGTIPTSIGYLKHIEQLDFESNQLTGTIPRAIGNLINLQLLYLDSNRLHGRIPAEIGNFTACYYLILSDNSFTGTLPDSLGNMKALTELGIEHNLLSGSIPSSLLQSSSLTVFDFSDNLFTGSFFPLLCNTSTHDTKLITFLNLYQNFFTGSIPTYCPMASVVGLQVNENMFTGSIDALASWYLISTMNISFNFFTGDLFLSSGYNETKTSKMPSIFHDLTLFTSIDVSNNFFSGSLSDALTTLTHLDILVMNSNMLSGTLDTLLAMDTVTITAMDLSDNQITGTLPSSLFENKPQLISFAAVKNCLAGSIPDTLCHCTLLQTLALDGLHSAHTCQNRFFTGVSSYELSSTVKDNIPRCLWNMTYLETLHVSGNGIKGSIPSDLSFGKRLQDISMSYNQFTGTIPMNFKTRSWRYVDLSFNKLKGSLDGWNSDNNSASSLIEDTLTLTVNRLSGNIPSNVQYIPSLDILRGNIFACRQDSDIGENGAPPSSLVPSNDVTADQYSCATNTIDSSLWFYFILSSIIGLLLGLFIWLATTSVKIARLEAMKDKCKTIYSFLLQCWAVTNQPTVEQAITQKRFSYYVIGYHFRLYRYIVLVLTLFIVVILLPVYIVMSLYFGTHEYSYAWTESMAYESGKTPALIYFVLGVVFSISSEVGVWYVRTLLKPVNIAIFDQRMKQQPSPIETTDMNMLSPAERRAQMLLRNDSARRSSVRNTILSIRKSFFDWKDELKVRRKWLVTHWKYTAIGVFLLVVNISVVLTINFLYVYGVSSGIPALELTFASIGLSIFKLLWNQFVVMNLFAKYLQLKKKSSNDNITMELIRHTFSDDDMNPEEDEATIQTTLRRVRLLTNIIVFNKIIAPFIASIFFEYNCFYYLVHAPPTMQTKYKFIQCVKEIADHSIISCIDYDTLTRLVSYSPPFVYSYQCSSALLHDFVEVFLSHYIISTFLIPVYFIVMKLLNNQPWYVTRKDKLRQWIESNMKKQDSPEDIIICVEKPQGDIELHEMAVNPMVETQQHSTSESNNIITKGGKTENELHGKHEKRFLSELFKRESFVIKYTSDIAVLLTFGLVFPPLAILICISILINCALKQVLLGRDVCLLQRRREQGIVDETEGAGERKEDYQYGKLFELFYPMIFGIHQLYAIFLGFFLFDILGDDVGALNACWIVIAMSLIPSIVLVCKQIYSVII